MLTRGSAIRQLMGSLLHFSSVVLKIFMPSPRIFMEQLYPLHADKTLPPRLKEWATQSIKETPKIQQTFEYISRCEKGTSHIRRKPETGKKENSDFHLHSSSDQGAVMCLSFCFPSLLVDASLLYLCRIASCKAHDNVPLLRKVTAAPWSFFVIIEQHHLSCCGLKYDPQC